jgi:hypothetical protein
MGKHTFRMYWPKWENGIRVDLTEIGIRTGFRLILTECVRAQNKPSAFIEIKESFLPS